MLAVQLSLILMRTRPPILVVGVEMTAQHTISFMMLAIGCCFRGDEGA
jgi:hypothetical protein